MAQQNPQDTFDLYGNLGGDPEPHSVPAKTGIARVYDPIVDDVVERPYNLPERNFLTYSIACGGYEDKPLRWISCVDWEGNAFRNRKGDSVRLHGHFQDRTYEKDGETKHIRQFVVLNAHTLRTKVRQEVP